MKISKIISVVVVVLLVGLGWYYYSNLQERPEQSKSSKTMYSDSIDAPDQPVITAQKDTTVDPVAEELAPGTALVSITVLSVDDTGDPPKDMTVRIEEVKGYGSSTSPISSNSELTIEVENIVKKDESISKQLKEGAELVAVISTGEETQTKEAGDERHWSLIELKTQ